MGVDRTLTVVSSAQNTDHLVVQARQSVPDHTELGRSRRRRSSHLRGKELSPSRRWRHGAGRPGPGRSDSSRRAAHRVQLDRPTQRCETARSEGRESGRTGGNARMELRQRRTGLTDLDRLRQLEFRLGVSSEDDLGVNGDGLPSTELFPEHLLRQRCPRPHAGSCGAVALLCSVDLVSGSLLKRGWRDPSSTRRAACA